MAIERWELAQRAKGNIAGAEMAKVLRDQYGDVPLPQFVQDLSQERPALDVVRFSQEAREALQKEGYRIYQIGGQSIKTLRDAGKLFWSTWHNDHPELEALSSRQSEVAINPGQLFLPDSNRKTLEEQEKMVQKFSKDLVKQTKRKDVEAVIGGMPDYVELAFTHLDATGDHLFGKNYDYNYARTKTPTRESHVARVGRFNADSGLFVSSWDRDRGDDFVFVAPLVVPKA